MRKLNFILILFLLIVVTYTGLARPWPTAGVSLTVPVKMLVSVESKHGAAIPPIYLQDVRVLLDKNRPQVTGWDALQGDRAGLELFVLLDDALNPTISLQFADLRQFMNDQPATTAIAVGYMQYGTVEIAQNFTKDHARAGQALRLPHGSVGNSPSPYLSISDLTKSWPESPARHEILVISSGIDLVGDDSLINPYVAEAIDRTQRTGIQVYAIYASADGHSGHSFWRLNSGQIYLSQLTDRTGGEFYVQGFETPVSFKPFLDQFADRLKHQYELTLLAIPESKPSYQRVRLDTEVPNAELVAADRVYIPTHR